MTTIAEYITALGTRPSIATFTLKDLPGFPYDEHSRLDKIYTEMEKWYSGQILEEVSERSGKKVEVYPVRINPIKAGVQKHTHALFGEVEEDDKPLVNPKVVFSNDAEKVLAEKAEDILNQVWYESNGRALQLENGGISQVYGGCVFKLSYKVDDVLRSVNLQIEKVHPRFFIGVPDSSDPWRLVESWIYKPITHADARRNGFSGELRENDVPWLTEHWTPSLYEVWVNDQRARRLVGTEWLEVGFSGNPYGFVPIVYIPHIRIEGFYGENFFDVVKGVIKEMNLRVADFGDSVNVDSHSYSAMKNVAGSPDLKHIAPGFSVIDLGNSMGISGNEQSPDLWEVRKSSASSAMGDLVDLLYDQYRRDAFIPKVSDGEDEGSQRSGLTLAMRMLSLLWHTGTERTFWTTGLNLLNRMILKILSVKDGNELGITDEHVKLRIREDWAPVLPRDRELLVNEVVARIGANLGSPETLLNMLGDVQDVDDEIARIVDYVEKIAKAEAEGQPQFPGNAGDRKKIAPGTPTTVSRSSE